MSGIIEVIYLQGITHEWLCYNFETNRYHLEIPIEYFDDEEKPPKSYSKRKRK